MKGWYGNSHKHSLASKGIKTKYTSNGIRNIDYSNPKEIFFGFWKANIDNNYSYFDFDRAFDIGSEQVEMWLGQVSYSPEEIVNEFEDKNGNFIEDNEGEGFGRGLLMYRDYRLAKIYLQLKNPPIKLQEKIFLMDKLIHMTHACGSIWVEYNEEWCEDIDIDVDELREEFERTQSGVGRFR